MGLKTHIFEELCCRIFNLVELKFVVVAKFRQNGVCKNLAKATIFSRSQIFGEAKFRGLSCGRSYFAQETRDRFMKVMSMSK